MTRSRAMYPFAEGSRDAGRCHAIRSVTVVLLTAAAVLGCGSALSPGMDRAGNGGHGGGGDGGVGGSGGSGGAMIGCPASTQPQPPVACCARGASDPLPYSCNQNTGEWFCGGYPSTPSGGCLNSNACPASTPPPGICCGHQGQNDPVPVPYGCDPNTGEWGCDYNATPSGPSGICYSLTGGSGGNAGGTGGAGGCENGCGGMGGSAASDGGVSADSGG